MFSKLTQGFKDVISNFTKYSKVSESNLSTTLKEVRRVLVSADVNFKVAKEVVEDVKNEIVGQKILSQISPREKFIHIINKKLIEMMGSTSTEVRFYGNPSIVLLCGLQGVGKTTFAVKLANYLRTKGKNPMIAACDVYRPAAIEQLKILGEENNLDVYSEDSKDVISIATNALKEAKEKNKTVLIIDTAGRLSIDEKMMEEIIDLKKKLSPSEIIYAVDSSVGQDAITTATKFDEAIDFSGIVLTKLDGDSKGGAALSISYVTKKPIKFISTGEKVDDIEIFHPDRMASRILGMGDVTSLVEKIETLFTKEEEKKLEQKIKKNSLDFNDFISQIAMIKRLGSMKSLISMIPGLSDKLGGKELDENIFDKFKHAIQSMTPYERKNPNKIDSSRISRIARGSGQSRETIEDLLSKFSNMQTAMKKMQKNSSWPF